MVDQNSTSPCETVGCDGFAEYLDDMDSKICVDCMNQRLADGEDPADFEFCG